MVQKEANLAKSCMHQ